MGFSAVPSLFSFSLPDPILSPGSGSCCSRPDPHFAAPLSFSAPSLLELGPSLVVSGRGGGLVKSVPAPPDAVGSRSRVPGPKERLEEESGSIPSEGRGARAGPGQERHPPLAPGDVRGGSGGAVAPFRRVIFGRGGTRARTPHLPGLSARVGTAGSPARAAR